MAFSTATPRLPTATCASTEPGEVIISSTVSFKNMSKLVHPPKGTVSVKITGGWRVTISHRQQVPRGLPQASAEEPHIGLLLSPPKSNVRTDPPLRIELRTEQLGGKSFKKSGVLDITITTHDFDTNGSYEHPLWIRWNEIRQVYHTFQTDDSCRLNITIVMPLQPTPRDPPFTKFISTIITKPTFSDVVVWSYSRRNGLHAVKGLKPLYANAAMLVEQSDYFEASEYKL